MKSFVKSWKSSVQPRKQHKYSYNAPLNIRQKFVGVHLSKELREKHGLRSMALRKGDEVKISRGQYKGKTAKVERVDLKKSKAYLAGIDMIKKDGSKTLYPISPSNLIIRSLNLEDKKRKKILDRVGKK